MGLKCVLVALAVQRRMRQISGFEMWDLKCVLVAQAVQRRMRQISGFEMWDLKCVLVAQAVVTIGLFDEAKSALEWRRIQSRIGISRKS